MRNDCGEYSTANPMLQWIRMEQGTPLPAAAPDRLDTLEEKLDTIQRTLDRMRRAAQLRLALTIVVIVLPFIGLLVVLPQMLATLGSGLGDLDAQIRAFEELRR